MIIDYIGALSSHGLQRSDASEMWEKDKNKNVSNYLNANQIITPSQAGFTPNDSTVYQLLSPYDDFCQSLDSEITTQVIFFHVSEAFDKVWHRGLLRKLHAIGIRGTLLNRFKNCLAECKQAVVLHGSGSDYLTVPAGVPQGYVVGPLLFLIYINGSVENIESVIKLFADNSSMYLGLENPQTRGEIFKQ